MVPKMKAIPLMQYLCIFALLISNVIWADVVSLTHNGDKVTLKPLPYELSIARIENGALKIENDTLEFTSHHGTDFFNDMIRGKKMDNAPRAIFEPKGDFVLSAKLSGKFSGKNDGGALIVYNDVMSSGKLTFERSVGGTQSLWSSITKGSTDDVHHRSFNETAMYLKIARKNDMYFFYSSNDGKIWDILRTFVLDKNESTKIGFLVQSPETNNFTMRFENINFQAKTFSDYWQGE